MRLMFYIKPQYVQRLKSVLVAVLGLFFSWSTIYGQGWEMTFGDPTDDLEVRDVIETTDHGYLMAGYKSSQNPDIFLMRTDVDGTLLWFQTYDRIVLGTSVPDFAYQVVATADGGFVVVGSSDGQNSTNDVFLMKVDANGNELWERDFGTTGNTEGLSVALTNNGGFIIAGYREVSADNTDIFLVRTDADGNELWTQNIGSADREELANSVIQTADGGFAVAGYINETDNRDFYIVKLDSEGNIEDDISFGSSDDEDDEAFSLVQLADGSLVTVGRWGLTQSDIYWLKLNLDAGGQLSFGGANIFGTTGEAIARSVDVTPEGDLIVGGRLQDDPIDSKLYLIKTDSDGNEIWSKTYGQPNSVEDGYATAVAHDGSYLLVGTTFEFPGTLIPFSYLIHTNSDGDIFSNYIEGNIFNDLDDNCVIDAADEMLANWTVRAEGNGEVYYATTDADGQYVIRTGLGTYNLSLIQPNEYWEACTEQYSINFTMPNDTIRRSFAVKARVDRLCADLRVDVSTPFLVPCSENTYTLRYRNRGTITAEDVQMIVEIDPSLSVIGGLTPSGGTADSLIFNLADLPPGEEGSFEIEVSVDCDAMLSQAHCIRAHIMPDTICLPAAPNWDGSSIGVEGVCDGDSVRFEIKNQGDNGMQGEGSYIIIEDQIMLRESLFDDLAVNEVTSINFSANGATYRLIAEQSEGHPGNSQPTVAVEGCTTNGDFTVGFLTQFEEDDADDFVAVDCQENLPSTEPDRAFFKRGYPKGYGDSLLISPETDLKYIINFQNTGMDTAIRVVIRDTLSPHLDPASVRPGASSHDYTFEVYGEGILKFTFEDISLPGSSTNATESLGFVKYRVSQKPDNTPATRIKNSAAIYLGYDEPGQTDEVCHKVEEDFIIVNTGEIFTPDVESVQVYPNPFTAATTFEVESRRALGPLTFSIMDVQGRLIRQKIFDSEKFVVERGNLASGLYIYTISAEGQLVNSGKLMVQ